MIQDFELSIYTLTGVMALPFLYFVYHVKFRFDYHFAKRADYIFAGISGLLTLLVIYKLKNSLRSGFDEIYLECLHFLPLVLNFLMVFALPKQFVTISPEGGESGTDYTPMPLNNEIERLTWNDLIIPLDLKQELISVMELLRDPKTAAKYGIEVPKGIIFNGPPGTGKTTVAKVIANQAGLSFFALQNDSVISKWVGESEKNLTKLFNAAIRSSPSVIFIDEIDSIGKERSGDSSQGHSDTLLNHLLQLIDGVIKTEGVYILAATNRGDLVDAALKRAGRLNKVIEIGLPDHQARMALFQLYLSRLTLEEALNLNILAELTKGLSPADIKEICNQAGLNAFKRESVLGKREYRVSVPDVEKALQELLKPAVRAPAAQ